MEKLGRNAPRERAFTSPPLSSTPQLPGPCIRRDDSEPGDDDGRSGCLKIESEHRRDRHCEERRDETIQPLGVESGLLRCRSQ